MVTRRTRHRPDPEGRRRWLDWVSNFTAAAAGVLIVNLIKLATEGDPMPPSEVTLDVLFIWIGLSAGRGARRARDRITNHDSPMPHL